MARGSHKTQTKKPVTVLTVKAAKEIATNWYQRQVQYADMLVEEATYTAKVAQGQEKWKLILVPVKAAATGHVLKQLRYEREVVFGLDQAQVWKVILPVWDEDDEPPMPRPSVESEKKDVDNDSQDKPPTTYLPGSQVLTNEDRAVLLSVGTTTTITRLTTAVRHASSLFLSIRGATCLWCNFGAEFAMVVRALPSLAKSHTHDILARLTTDLSRCLQCVAHHHQFIALETVAAIRHFYVEHNHSRIFKLIKENTTSDELKMVMLEVLAFPKTLQHTGKRTDGTGRVKFLSQAVDRVIWQRKDEIDFNDLMTAGLAPFTLLLYLFHRDPKFRDWAAENLG